MDILDVINCHKGKENAITSDRILDAIGGYPGGKRALMDTIKRLIEDDGHLIAACGHGYYIPITQNELDDYEKNLDSRERSIKFRRLAVIKMRGQLPPEQTRLNFEVRP